MADLPLILTDMAVEREDDCACPNRAFVLVLDDRPADLDQDCACPDRAITRKYAVDQGLAFVQTLNTHTSALPRGHHLAFSPYAPAGPSVLNPAAWARWQSFGTPQRLTQDIDHVLAGQRLICPQGVPLRPRSAQPETLTAWLHVTNACNLDCPYCYVRKSSARMSEQVGVRAVESVFCSARQHGFKWVKLKYAGGEATLHFRLVRRLHKRARELSAATGLGLKEVVLSNGMHIHPEDTDWMIASGVKLMISVDGVGELHNLLRPQKGGGDSFERVEHSVDRVLLPRGLFPDVSTTVTRLNASGVADVVKWALIDRGLPTSLNFHRQNILSASRADLAFEEAAIIDGMLDAYAVIEASLPTQPFFNGLLDRVQTEAHSHTCGVGQSYVVITHTGRLAQCQMHLDAPVSPDLDGDLIRLAAVGPLQSISVDSKVDCRECEYRYLCSGGCPLETHRATGRWDVQSPNCRIYKALLPSALRLEGLRLMKVRGLLN